MRPADIAAAPNQFGTLDLGPHEGGSSCPHSERGAWAAARRCFRCKLPFPAPATGSAERYTAAPMALWIGRGSGRDYRIRSQPELISINAAVKISRHIMYCTNVGSAHMNATLQTTAGAAGKADPLARQHSDACPASGMAQGGAGHRRGD